MAETEIKILAVKRADPSAPPIEPNSAARFGHGLAQWLAVIARFVTGAADQRPFPWTS